MGDELARQHQRLRKVRAHRLEIMQHGKDRAPLAMPASDHADEIGHRARVDRRKGFVEEHQPRILQQEPREERPLHLTARERPDGAGFEPCQTHGRNRRGNALAMVPSEAPEGTDLAPETHGDEIDH